ncbi:NmrA-domain-containing protein [Cadophora sp. DSE1049]|nr:NmrA-domain-containing protein [Cadophora sp. DSE1049]
MSKLLTVFGATGQQGGSLIDYILKTPELSALYRVRGITRDASKTSAVALIAKGVEVIEADLDKPPTLAAALAGSYAVFGVTNYWERASKEVEIAQGKAIADASVAAGAKLLIWSSLPSVARMSNGKAAFKHFDSKAEVEEYVRTLPILSAFFMAGWYMQNHIGYMRPQPKGDGTYNLSQTFAPTATLPMIDITDTGKFIAPILLDPTTYNGKNFTCATKFLSPLQLVEGWTKVTGKSVTYTMVSPDDMVSDAMTPEMRAELKKSADLINEFSYFGQTGQKDLEWTQAQLKDKLTSWEEFVKANEPWFEGV